jgi:hypothetical protein
MRYVKHEASRHAQRAGSKQTRAIRGNTGNTASRVPTGWPRYVMFDPVSLVHSILNTLATGTVPSKLDMIHGAKLFPACLSCFVYGVYHHVRLGVCGGSFVCEFIPINI